MIFRVHIPVHHRHNVPLKDRKLGFEGKRLSNNLAQVRKISWSDYKSNHSGTLFLRSLRIYKCRQKHHNWSPQHTSLDHIVYSGMYLTQRRK